MPTVPQTRFQKKIEVVLAAAPPLGWPADKYTTPGIVHLNANEGPYIIKVVSGNCTIAASFSSAQEVYDNVATYEDWPAGAVVGPYPSDVIEEAEALRITATADCVVEIMGIRS